MLFRSVYAAGTQSQLINFYRAMGRHGHHCLGGSTTGEGALKLMDSVRPSILSIVDDLPDMSLADIAKQARKIHPQIRLIAFITNPAKAVPNTIIPVLIADDDLLAHPEVITVATMAVVANTTYRSPSLTSGLPEASPSPADQEKGPFDLSLREQQLLEAYALGLSNKELAERLGLSVRTVQTYSANLLQRLGVNNRQKALRRAISLGFKAAVRRLDVS